MLCTERIPLWGYGGTGRRFGLKIRWACPVWVRVPLSLLADNLVAINVGNYAHESVLQ